MKDLGIQKKLLEYIDTSSSKGRNYYSIRKLIRENAEKLNIPFYDECCPLANEGTPVRFKDDILESYNSTTDTWVEVPTGGASGFTPASVIFADGSGDLTDDGSTFSYNTTTNTLTINSISIGRGLAGEAQSLVIGNSSGTSLLSGSIGNTFLGYDTGKTITTGDYNVIIGWQAAQLGSNGSGNVAIGGNAMQTVNGSWRVAIGPSAMNKGGGSNSVAIGASALFNGTSNGVSANDGNTAIGASSMMNLGQANGSSISAQNTALGFNSGLALTTEANGVFIGVGCASSGTGTGRYNNVIGQGAMLSCGSVGTSGNNALGYYALSGLTTSVGYNIALGHSAGSSITSGAYNVVIGGNNGASIATSSNNILISDGQGNLKLTIDSAHIFTITNGLQNFVDDAAAAIGGIPVNGLYRNGSIVMIRVA